MRASVIDALWNFFTTSRRTQAVDDFLRAASNEALAVLDISEVGPSSSGPAATAPECNRAEPEGSPPTADLGAAGVGARYFTVKLESQGRISYRHFEALDEYGANRKARAGNLHATAVELVRAINRSEYERLTRVPS